MFEPTKAPWIRPGVVIHEPNAPVDGLLEKFAMTLRERGFNVGLSGQCEGMEHAARSLRHAMRDDADLVVISRFPAFEAAAREMLATIEDGAAQGMPVITSISGGDLQQWLNFAGQRGTILAPNMRALWQWWGPERLYADLALGVANDEVRDIVCGPRWLMVQGPAGAGLAYLPRSAKELLPRLPQFKRKNLRQLAQLSQSWDPLEMALGIAAINAHYNRFDLNGDMGNGAETFGHEAGRVVVIGAFPGLADALANPQVIENEPRPGEYPTIAMDTLLPGCAAAVVASSTIINRTLPRILRLAHGSRVALVGPAAPLTPRLYHYGIEVIGGLIITDPTGLAAAIRAGAMPREFVRFGQYRHIHHERPAIASPCRFRAVNGRP